MRLFACWAALTTLTVLVTGLGKADSIYNPGEICPARLTIKSIQSRSADNKAALFGIVLSAFGPRAVTSELAFDTDRGWFTLRTPPVELRQQSIRYNSALGPIVEKRWISEEMYVSFPGNVLINHAWVYAATTKGATGFDWDSKGRVVCPEPIPKEEQFLTEKTVAMATSRVASSGMRASAPQVDTGYLEALAKDPPAGTASTLKAVPSNALETPACAIPFQDGSIQMLSVPAFPDELATTGFSGLIGVRVLVGSDGSLIHSWVFGASGNARFDSSAISGARQSSYLPAQSYCKPVPALYNYFILFAGS